MTDRWIEWECPVTGVDFDLEPIVGPDVAILCSDCGRKHRAASVGQLLEIVEDGRVIRLDEDAWRALAATIA